MADLESVDMGAVLRAAGTDNLYIRNNSLWFGNTTRGGIPTAVRQLVAEARNRRLIRLEADPGQVVVKRRRYVLTEEGERVLRTYGGTDG